MLAVEYNPPGKAPALIGAVKSYWASKCAGGCLPSRDAIRPSEIRAWLPHILLADVLDGGSDFRYRLVGTRIAQDFTLPPTGRRMSEALAAFGRDTVADTIRTYRQVVETARPLQLRGAGDVFAQGAKTFDAILLPLRDGGTAVTMVFGAFVFEWNSVRNAAQTH